MIYYCCALYIEAKPIIEYYKLKRLNVKGRYQFFVDAKESDEGNGKALLVVCGTGRDNANSAVTMLCTMFPPKDSDIFVNYGICGAFSESSETCVGDVFMATCAKNEEDNVIYTDCDLLCPCEFKKAELRTFSKPVESKPQSESMGVLENTVTLADMEGYGALFGASLFFEAHRTFAIKVVSDVIGEKEHSVDKALAESVIERSYKAVVEYSEKALAFAEEASREASAPELSNEEQESFERFSELLCLSAAMEDQLLCILRRRLLQGKSVMPLMESFSEIIESELVLENKTINRKSGKEYFSRFKKYEVNYA
jgi:hypothetical protein